jgi:hypothetical protein
MIKQLIAATVLAASANCHAAEPATPPDVTHHFYVGLDAGATKVVFTNDSTRGSYGAFAGYAVNSNLAVEVAARRLYQWSGWVGARESTGQASLSLIGSLPLTSKLGVYGRVGVNQLRTSAEGMALIQGDLKKVSYKYHTTPGMYGLGATYKLTDDVSARLEVQRPGRDMSNYSAGISYAF